MNRSLIISSVLHALLIFITAMSLPFLAKKPLDIPPIVSVELIQIAEKTNIPFAPKAKKIIEKVKEKEKKLVSEQAPPKKVEKTKTKTVLAPEQNNKKIENETPEAIPLPEKTLKKVGEKWSAFQTINFKNNSQPYYVLLSPNLEVLNKPIQYTDTDTYQSWLSEGLENFKKNYK